MEKVCQNPLAKLSCHGKFWERSDETIRGCVPHLIVSSDTESRVAGDRQRRYEGDAKSWLVRRACFEAPPNTTNGARNLEIRSHISALGMLVGLVAVDQMGGGEFGGLVSLELV